MTLRESPLVLMPKRHRPIYPVLHLAGKHTIEINIIRTGGENGSVGSQGQSRQTRPVEILAIGGASTITAQQKFIARPASIG